MENIFEIDNFNIIEDEENYYFFRALNKADSQDITNGIILDKDGKYARIRTDRERYEENPENEKTKYNAQDEISLEQVHDHVKMHYRKDTNCISLSSNANVLLDYGRRNYNDEYIMVKVPKKEMGDKVKFAGQYMLEEIEKRINVFISSLDKSDENNKKIYEELKQIENATSEKKIKDLIKVKYTSSEPISEKKPIFKEGLKIETPHARISSYQSLNDEQNLEKNKIIGKLILLERKADMGSLINYVENDLVCKSLGNAFSSMEQVHYGDIPGEQVKNVPSIIMDMFALLQQIEYKNFPNIKKIEKELITFINNGTKIEIPKDSILFRNDKVRDNITIEEMYQFSGGKVEYGMTNSIVKNMFYLAKSRLRAKEISNILNKITGNNPEYKEIIEYIEKNGFEIEPELIKRQSNRGNRISESVNLDLKNNEIPLIDAIKNLSTEEQVDILEKGGLSDIRGVITDIFSKIQRDEKITLEEYFAGAIIDLYNWKKIGVDEFTVEQRNEFINKLKEKNCIQIYKKLKDAGVKEKDIPLYLLNIASKEQLNDIVKSKNYIKKIQQNREILTKELSIQQIETFLGYYDVKGTGIILRDYQRNAVVKTDEIFENKRFASVVLPTGAGKTFVALTELLEHKNEHMLYLAPQNEILEQTKDRIIEYIHGKAETIGKSKDEIIAEVFPNIKFETYGGLLARRGKKIIQDKYGFIVLDELHRTGAKEWEEKIDELIENQSEKTKLLGITATPIRDMDERNMAIEMAVKLGYTKEEIQDRKHIAIDMNLINAIKLGIVVNPRIISCEYNIKDDDILENILESINSEKNEEKKKDFLSRYENLRRNIDKAEGISEILNQNIKPGGRYIVFIPVTEKNEEFEDEDGNKIGKKTGKEKIEEYQKKIKEYMEQTQITSKYYSMLGAYSDRENGRQLEAFEKDSSENAKFMIVMNKANEGLHIKGLDGMIWFRPLDENSKILYLQQLGRVIYSEEPNNQTLEDKRPVVIDLVNNTLKVDIDKSFKENSEKDDLELLTLVVNWAKLHNGLPNIESSDKTEQRYAATLYRIANKYKNAKNKNQKHIEEILKKGAEIDLWDIEVTQKQIEKVNNVLEVPAFEIRGVLKDLVDLENDIIVKSVLLNNAKEIENWCIENYGDKKIWERRLPSVVAESEEERKLGNKLTSIRRKIREYEFRGINNVEDEEIKQMVEIVKKLDSEYGLATSVKHAMEIENWCIENYGDKKIWERNLPSKTTGGKYEKELGVRLNSIKTKVKYCERVDLDKIENENDKKIVEILERINAEYGLKKTLKYALEIENWCKEHYGNKKAWEKNLPNVGSKDEYEKILANRLRYIRKRELKKYEGINLENIENQEDRKTVEIIRRIDKEYGIDIQLKNALEIENWCIVNYEDKKVSDRKLPSQTAKDEYEKRLGIRISAIRKNILNKYEGVQLDKIEDEKDRKIVEIIRRLDREYNYKKFKSQDIGKASYDAPVEICDSLEEDLTRLVEEKRMKNVDKTNYAKTIQK